MDENQTQQQGQEPAAAESLAPAAVTPYDELDFAGLRETAKSRGLSAGGSAEELKARLLEADANPADPDAPDAPEETDEQADAPASISAAEALQAAQDEIDRRHGRK